MKIVLSREEVNRAVEMYLLLRGYEVKNGMTHFWSSGNGLDRIETEVERHSYTDDSIVKHIKES